MTKLKYLSPTPGGDETQENQQQGEGGAQVQVCRDAGDPVRVAADGARDRGRAAIPPTATADAGGVSQPQEGRAGDCHPAQDGTLSG